MKYLHYFDCSYAEQDDEDVISLEWWNYPCYHPANKEHKCLLKNKKGEQKDICPYQE